MKKNIFNQRDNIAKHFQAMRRLQNLSLRGDTKITNP